MNKTVTLEFIKNCQQRWATSRGITFNRDARVPILENNLFKPLTPQTRIEFEAGDGDEFGTEERIGKIYSLHSSSALVCNFFDYWRGQTLTPLFEAVGIPITAEELRFEQKFLTGVGSRPANLDVLISDRKGQSFPVAIESKFTEIYQSGKRDCLRPSYFQYDTTWQELPSCRTFAEALTQTKRFQCVKAAQLLKHILGLTGAFGKRRFTLLYLWYEVEGSSASRCHGTEIGEFAEAIKDDVCFRADTYQNVFTRLQPSIKGSPYEMYLRSRYFGTTVH